MLGGWSDTHARNSRRALASVRAARRRLWAAVPIVLQRKVVQVALAQLAKIGLRSGLHCGRAQDATSRRTAAGVTPPSHGVGEHHGVRARPRAGRRRRAARRRSFAPASQPAATPQIPPFHNSPRAAVRMAVDKEDADFPFPEFLDPDTLAEITEELQSDAAAPQWVPGAPPPKPTSAGGGGSFFEKFPGGARGARGCRRCRRTSWRRSPRWRSPRCPSPPSSASWCAARSARSTTWATGPTRTPRRTRSCCAASSPRCAARTASRATPRASTPSARRCTPPSSTAC